MAASTALRGVRVLECTHFISGPRCGQLLADHGAEVIKIEPPSGDPARKSPPIRSGWSLYFAAHNRRKESVSVDLKQDGGRLILRRLIEWADVLITNYTPGASERLGLDFHAASQVNPRIVVVRISAFGLSGADRNLPGFDGTVQARSGFAHMVGPQDRPPTVTSVPVLDFLGAVEGAYGALLGLHQRDQTGQGTEVDVSMMDAASTVLGYLYAEVIDNGKDPKRTGSRAPYALTGAYQSLDGFLYIAPIGYPAWKALAEFAGHPEWAAEGAPYLDADTRLRDRAIIEDAIECWTKQLTNAQVMDACEGAGIPCGVIKSVKDVVADPLLAERHMIQPVELGTTGTTVPMPGTEIKIGAGGEQAGGPDDAPPVVPDLGADTEAVLGRLGFSAGQIAQWRSDQVIFEPDSSVR
jgi:crotonobetainyl-CoA:carnitine CoA-transferase CaiB-like acyl-CoA transferase